MYTVNIALSGVQEVKKFVDYVSKFSFDIELSSGRYSVDAKSIMGVFSLDLEKPITLTASSDDEAFKEGLKQFRLV